MRDADAPLPRTYKDVRSIVIDQFELREFVFGPDTDLISIADQIGDPERVEWVLEAIDRKFSMQCPMVEDSQGRRRAQLFIDDTLTIVQLAAIVDSGQWPERWRTPKRYVPMS